MQRSCPDMLELLSTRDQMIINKYTTWPCWRTCPINPFHTSQAQLQTPYHESCWASDLLGGFQGNPWGSKSWWNGTCRCVTEQHFNLKYQTALKCQRNECETFHFWLTADNKKPNLVQGGDWDVSTPSTQSHTRAVVACFPSECQPQIAPVLCKPHPAFSTLCPLENELLSTISSLGFSSIITNNSILLKCTRKSRSPHWSPFFPLQHLCFLQWQRPYSHPAVHFRALFSPWFFPSSRHA